MSFPKLTLATLPPSDEIQCLSDWETNDGTANVCISLWQYAQVLLKLDDEGALTPRVKSALKMLYFSTSPITAGDLKESLNEKAIIVVQGQPGLGGFAAKFLDRLRSDFPALQFPQPYSGTGNVFIQVILDLMFDKKGGNIHFYLRSRFRAALAQCFGDEVIRNW